mmetsp:Transcript_8602/g.28666  ORF Transcript_8602/g.28666 Transcript_8602/m.28666 type:complete len:219 (+) Transcript_8602:794-1450(+)
MKPSVPSNVSFSSIVVAKPRVSTTCSVLSLTNLPPSSVWWSSRFLPAKISRWQPAGRSRPFIVAFHSTSRFTKSTLASSGQLSVNESPDSSLAKTWTALPSPGGGFGSAGAAGAARSAAAIGCLPRRRGDSGGGASTPPPPPLLPLPPPPRLPPLPTPRRQLVATLPGPPTSPPATEAFPASSPTRQFPPPKHPRAQPRWRSSCPTAGRRRCSPPGGC